MLVCRTAGYTLRMLLMALVGILVAMSGVLTTAVKGLVRMLNVTGWFVPGRHVFRSAQRDSSKRAAPG